MVLIGSSHAPVALLPGQEVPVPIECDVRQDPGPVWALWRKAKSFSHAGTRKSPCPAQSLVIVLYKLSLLLFMQLQYSKRDIQFCPPDDEHMCSKHVEAWKKFIKKFSGSSWLILRNKFHYPVHMIPSVTQINLVYGPSIPIFLQFCSKGHRIRTQSCGQRYTWPGVSTYHRILNFV